MSLQDFEQSLIRQESIMVAGKHRESGKIKHCCQTILSYSGLQEDDESFDSKFELLRFAFLNKNSPNETLQNALGRVMNKKTSRFLPRKKYNQKKLIEMIK